MAGKSIVLEAGLAACASGAADWCPRCGLTRYRSDMRWLGDLYACRACLPEAIELPEP